MKSIIIFYHKNCPDGFGAAFAAWKKFGNKAEYVAVKASQENDQLHGVKLIGKEVYFLDVCASAEALKGLVATNKSVIVIDHHETNRGRGNMATRFVFDIRHSGSMLAWNYFHANKKTPWLLRYVEDGDLWKFKLPHSREISTRYGLFPFTFKAWDTLMKAMERSSLRAQYAKEGAFLLEFEDAIIRGILENAYEVNFLGYRAKVANTSVAHSQVGNLLIDKKHPIGITWYEIGKTRKYSLRSKGSTDVSKLAKQFPGGGGHTHAAGFMLPANQRFPWNVL